MDARLSFDFATSFPCPVPVGYADQLVSSHRSLVDRIARRVFREMSSAIPVEDLVQIGNIALIVAARTFVDRGIAQFSTYATVRVRGAMIDELRKAATISRPAMRHRRKFADTLNELSSSLGRTPNDCEMAAKLEMPVETYRGQLASTQTVERVSIDDAYSDNSIAFADTSPGADELIDNQRRHTAIAAAMAQLSDREQTILQMFFVDERSLQEIGTIFDVSQARICQIKRGALMKLREDLKQW